MGVESRKPPLPAPTESSTLQTSGGSGEEADLATDLSRRTDKTSYSIPEDGSPVTIPTKKRRGSRGREKEETFARSSNKSQTSLLIEYFGGGKSPTVHSRPSVRVKVTPSAARKIKETNEHVQVTASKGGRKPSYTRRISLGPQSTGERQVSGSGDDRSISSYTSAAEDSSLAHRHPPVEIEVMHGDDASDLSRTSIGKEETAREERYMQVNPSEISSMPPDSMLDERPGNRTPRRNRSRSISKEALVNDNNTLKTPSRRRSRSLSKERLAHKAAEKIAARPREVSNGKHKRSSKTRSRSGSSEQIAEIQKSGRRRSSKSYKEEELASGAESSLLTTSQMSPQRKSGDQYSIRSGTSKSSINANPRLLETVENAIKRLIMPELEHLKQEQKMQQSRQKFERDSVASVDSSTSRGELSRKLSKHASAPNVSGKPKVYLNRDEQNAGTLLSGDSVKGRKESRRRRESESPSERQFSREMSEETVIRDGEKASRKKSKEGHRLRDAAAGGIAGGILTAAALDHHNRHKEQDLKHYDSKSSIDRKERRRRKSSKSHSRSASLAESTEDAFIKHDVPPMPMQSDIQSSEITRDSILSERTEEPSSASEEIRMAEIRHVSRGSPREVLSPASRTPTRTPLGVQKGLGTYHSNQSQGDLHGHSPNTERIYRNDEENTNIKSGESPAAAADAGSVTGYYQTDDHAQNDMHDLSYQRESRGLSPIQSVSSRQESEVDRKSFRHRHSTTSLSSLKQHERKASNASLKSLGSPVSVDMRRLNRPRGINFEPGEDVLAQHGLRESQYTEADSSDRDPAMDEWLQQEHEKNDRYRDSMDESKVDYRHMTNFTDDSMDAPYLDKVTAAQELQGGSGGRNPDFVHTPVAVESAVASLLDASTVSMRSRQEGKSFTGSHEGGEAIVEGELQSRNLEKGSYHEASNEYDEISAKGSPRQSVAQSNDGSEEPVTMGASGIPVADDPIPEIGHGLNSDSDISTNPSIIQGPMGGFQDDNLDHWPNEPTPPQTKGDFSQSKDCGAHESLKAAAAGFLTAAATASRNHSPKKQSVSRDLSLKENYQPQAQDEYEAGIKNDFATNRDSYMSRQTIPSPPKDEGYGSGPQPHSPQISFNNVKAFNDGVDDNVDDDDVFVDPAHTRHLSTNSHGLAHGMGSPLYDSATGGGIDRIQSKDIVALMDHVCIYCDKDSTKC